MPYEMLTSLTLDVSDAWSSRYTLADDLGSVTGLPAFCDGCVALALSGPRVLYPRVLGSLSPLRCSPYPRIAAYSFHYLEPTDCTFHSPPVFFPGSWYALGQSITFHRLGSVLSTTCSMAY